MAPLTHRSVSQYGTFTRCGEQYRLTKVERAPETPAAWFYQGTAFHECIDVWERGDRSLPADDVVELFRTVWHREITEAREREPDLSKWLTGGRTKPETDITNRYERGQDQVRAYMEWAPAQPWTVWEFTDGHRACELPFEITLGGVRIIGSIDQVVEYPDGSLRVRDLKTGARLPDTAFQLAVYDLALESLFGFRCGWGDFYMAKNTACTEPFDLSHYTADRLGRWFRDMDAAVRLGVFLPNPGDACRTCTVRRFCDAGGVDSELYPTEGSKDYQ